MFRSMYRAIRHEVGLKMLSILMAFGLWIYVINTSDPIRTASYDRTIATLNVPKGLEVVKIRPERVRVRVRARLSALERESLAGMRLAADLSDTDAGRNQVLLQVVGAPERVTVLQLARPTAQIWLDHSVAEKFPVVPVVLGSPAEGCELLGTPTVQPAEVRVSGPAETVDEVSQVIVRIDVTGFNKKRQVTGTPVALNDRKVPVSGVLLDQAKVSVDVPIFQVTTKRVAVRPRVGAPPAGYVVTEKRPSPDTVTLKGRPEALRSITEIKTDWQNIRGLRTTKEYRVRLVLPRGVWLTTDSETVLLRVTVRPVPIVQPEPDAGSGETPQEPSPDSDAGAGGSGEPAGGGEGPAGGEPPEGPAGDSHGTDAATPG